MSNDDMWPEVATSKITPQHRRHMDDISNQFSLMMSKKYVAGVIEHGGHLKDMSCESLLDNAIDEAIDQVVYLYTLKDNLEPVLEKAWKYDELG